VRSKACQPSIDNPRFASEFRVEFIRTTHQVRSGNQHHGRSGYNLSVSTSTKHCWKGRNEGDDECDSIDNP
jgi:hypothetical protein